MYKYLLESTGNIDWMAIFALITFVLIFVIATANILRRDSAFIEKMANMPLDDNPSLNPETADRHEK